MQNDSEEAEFPYKIVVDEGADESSSKRAPYERITKRILMSVLPPGCLRKRVSSSKELGDQAVLFREFMPLVTWSHFKPVPLDISFFLVCVMRQNAFKFFYEMISRWLIPGQPLTVVSFFATDFMLPEISKEKYMACEILLHVDNPEHFKILQRNLPIIETEVRIGVESSYHANRILEVKGLSSDVKTAMIQEHIVSLLQRRSSDFDYDVFTEMQHFLVMSPDDFKAAREYRHMGRIISVLYLFRKKIREEVLTFPNKRQLRVKLQKGRLHVAGKMQNVLGVLVALNFLGLNEVLEERHIVKAIQNYVPQTCSVQGSFFSNTGRTDNICTMYLEVRKPEGNNFTLDEIKRLSKELPIDLKDRIEHLMNPIFMPRNEEEVMRNILVLSDELSNIRDLPQVIITFEKQSDQKISFTIILVRVLLSDPPSIEKLFQSTSSFLTYIPDQIRTVGALRKKYAKEANVFRVEIDKSAYLRADHSLDLYKARQAVAQELKRVVGEFRDYNGGMITKQNELFGYLKDSLGNISKAGIFLLENFFYSINPAVMRNVLEASTLKKLFLLLQKRIEGGFFAEENYSIETEEDDEYLYLALTVEYASVGDKIQKELNLLGIPLMGLASVFLVVYDVPSLAFLYRSTSLQERERFKNTVKKAITP